MAQGIRPIVRIQVKHGIELKELAQVLERAVALGPQGCRACGLLGFDLSFVVDPERINLKEIHNVAGVEGVTVGVG
jgi:hypothetical protein